MSVKQYDRFIPLFTDDVNDKRSTFFLSELKHAANKSRGGKANYGVGDLKIIDATGTGVIAKFFNNQEGKGDNEVHPAWTRFAAAVSVARNANTSAKGVLDIIKSLSNPKPGSVDELVQVLLGSFLLEEVRDTSSIITTNASKWSGATSFKFKTQTNLAKAFNDSSSSNFLFVDAIVNATDIAKISKFNGLTTYADNEIKHMKSLVPVSVVGTVTINSATVTNPVTDLTTLDGEIATANGSGNSSIVAAAKAEGIKVIKLIQLFLASEKSFGYKVDEFFIRRMLGDAADAPVPSNESSWFTEQDNIPKEYIYYRKADGRLYMKDAQNKEVAVDARSEAVQNLKINDKCVGTGFSNYRGVTCAEYLQSCLEGGDVAQCRDFLAEPNYWATAEKEVEHMLPPIALKTLQAFEFKKEEYNDETARRKLFRIVSYTRWLASLHDMVVPGKIVQADYDQIAKNTKLQGYLEMLVKKVNSNPGILNKDYVGGETDNTQVYNPTAFVGTRLDKYGIKPNYPVDSVAPSSFERLRLTQEDNKNRVGVTIGLPNTFGLSYKVNLSGGANNSIERNEEYLADATRQLHSVLGKQYLALVARLKARGKEIAEVDAKKIRDLIEELKQKETKMVKLVLMTEKYASLLEVHGQNDPNGVLTIDHLKEFVDQRNQYFQRVAKKQSDIISIIKSIAEAVNKETPKKEEKKEESKVSNLSIFNLLG